ncbi:hypothetical protein L596_012371 [Steinernema carpocapsae]|uniref:Uncharacterized protein n=1 Tax=Steinernema carpocapsae TaxID=34508 RepID=A0A4V6A4T8_STECR|nr:hypothetical protein L596_012371 [Steinernema carpocapsae]
MPLFTSSSPSPHLKSDRAGVLINRNLRMFFYSSPGRRVRRSNNINIPFVCHSVNCPLLSLLNLQLFSADPRPDQITVFCCLRHLRLGTVILSIAPGPQTPFPA